MEKGKEERLKEEHKETNTKRRKKDDGEGNVDDARMKKMEGAILRREEEVKR